MAASGSNQGTQTQPTGGLPVVAGEARPGLSSSAFALAGLISSQPKPTASALDTKTPAIPSFNDFLTELSGEKTRAAVYETLLSKASFPKLASDAKTFFETQDREGAKFTLEHLAIEPLVLVALIIQAAKSGRTVATHFGGPMLEPVTVLGEIFESVVDEKTFPFYPGRVLHIHTEEILASNKSHKVPQKFAAINGNHNAGSPKDLTDAEIFIFECYGSSKAGQQVVKNSVPPTGAIFASMMRYYLKLNPNSLKVFCGGHHDVKKPKAKAIEDAKQALAVFNTEHEPWKRGSLIPTELLGLENASKGQKVSFITEEEVRESDEYKLVLAKLMQIFSKDESKKQKFIEAIVTATSRHLLDQFSVEKGCRSLKELKNKYNGKQAKVTPPSTNSDTSSGSGSSPSGSDSEVEDERIIKKADRLRRRVEKMGAKTGRAPNLLDMQALMLVDMEALIVNGTFAGRGNSPEGKRVKDGKSSPSVKVKDLQAANKPDNQKNADGSPPTPPTPPISISPAL